MARVPYATKLEQEVQAMTDPPEVPDLVTASQVEYALRRMRPGCLEVSVRDGLCHVALTMAASPAGRRNAAEKIVGYLGAAGLRLDDPEPVGALAGSGTALTVLRSGVPGITPPAPPPAPR